MFWNVFMKNKPVNKNAYMQVGEGKKNESVTGRKRNMVYKIIW